MKTSTISLLCAASLLAACTTPASLTASADAQHDACHAAELKGQLGEAELACVQALRMVGTTRLPQLADQGMLANVDDVP